MTSHLVNVFDYADGKVKVMYLPPELRAIMVKQSEIARLINHQRVTVKRFKHSKLKLKFRHRKLK